jgi:hypothetical protein
MTADNPHYQGTYPRVPTTDRALRRGAVGAAHTGGASQLRPQGALQMLRSIGWIAASLLVTYLRATFRLASVSGSKRAGRRELFQNHSLLARQVYAKCVGTVFLRQQSLSYAAATSNCLESN